MTTYPHPVAHPGAATLPHVLAVDDDPAIRTLLAEYLAENELRVSVAANGAEAALLLATEAIDLVVLDLRLPGEDGMLIARRLRERSALPIIVVSGRLHEADRVMALELGADDYLTKPFSPRELLARIRSVLRRSALSQAAAAPPPVPAGRPAAPRAYRFAGWELNLGARRLLAPDGAQIDLTNGEFSLLASFLAAPHCILTREQLLQSSRLHDDVYDRSIDVQILRLRRKIEADPAHPAYIKTERGAGYMFCADVSRLDPP